jgi:hypothetical protein
VGVGLLLMGATAIYVGYQCLAVSLGTGQFELAGPCGLIGGVVGALGLLGGFAVLNDNDCLPNSKQ